ncbi:MAG: metal ABC transporter ATP-binding protein [Actinomycetota bacterium]
MSTPVVELRDVSFSYESGPVLSDINLTIGSQDYVVLLGANGAGKSTLVKVALGLLEPGAGRALLFGRPARDARARERVGYVPQRAAISGRVPATVLEVVLAQRAGRRLVGPFLRSEREMSMRALQRVGLEDLAGRRIGDLSGGQQQRALIARALVSEPGLLVLDEPTAGVDRESQVHFAGVLRELHTQGVAVVIVAHDLGAVGNDLTRVLALHQGHIDEVPPAEAREQVGLFVEDHPH